MVDKNGTEITEGSLVNFHGRISRVTLLANGELGISAMNPNWSGKAVEESYWPLNSEEFQKEDLEVVE